MTSTEVEIIAQGQVWTGKEAQEVGLVDRLGDLQEAIETAAALAELDDYHTRRIEEALTPFQQFLYGMTAQALTPIMKGVRSHMPLADTLWQSANRVQNELNMLIDMNDPRGLYLHCLECKLY